MEREGGRGEGGKEKSIFLKARSAQLMIDQYNLSQTSHIWRAVDVG